MDYFYEVILPYYKQGDDFSSHLEDCNGDPVRALRQHAGRMDKAAECLRALADAIEHEPGITMDGDTHCIRIEGPEATLERLANADLIGRIDLNDEEEDEED